MSWTVVIAHAKGEEAYAEELATPLVAAGYVVWHRGTVLVGESFSEEAQKALATKGPVVLCATSRAMGTRFARRLASGAGPFEGTRVFVVRMEEEADVEQLALDTPIAEYWKDKGEALEHLQTALQKYFPVAPSPGPRIGSGAEHAHALRRYREAMLSRYRRLDLEGLTPPKREEYLQVELRSVFVEPRVREEPPPTEVPAEVLRKLPHEEIISHAPLPSALEEVWRTGEAYYNKPAIPVLDALAAPSNLRAVVLGNPGSGKSTFAKYLLLSLVSDDGDKRPRHAFADHLPLMIELRAFTALQAKYPDCRTFLDYWHHVGETEGYHLTKELLADYFYAGRPAAIIFDGLDEIFDPEERDAVARQIVGMASDHPHLRIIVTSRLVGYRRAILTGGGFTHLTLQELDDAQVALFLERWYGLALQDRPEDRSQRCARVLRAFDDSPSVRQLARNPMLLTIIAIIAKHQDLPRERWRLYNHASSVLLEHWDINRHLRARSVDAEFIDEDDKRELLRIIARAMQAGYVGPAGNFILREKLQELAERYLGHRFTLPPTQARLIAREMIRQLRERNFVLSLYGSNVFGFVHRAFLEFFCAEDIVVRFERTRELTPDQLKRELFGVHHIDEAWHEVLRLVSGMLDSRFSGEVIRYLVEEAGSAAVDQNAGALPWNIALAAKCLSEVRQPNTVAEAAGLLLPATINAFCADMNAYPRLFSFFKGQVLPAAQAIGRAWPGREVLAVILEQLSPGQFSYIYDRQFGRFVGVVGGGVPSVHERVLDAARRSEPSIRVLAPHALGVGWPDDPGTPRLLRKLATEDEAYTVRYAAIAALGDYFHNRPDTYSLLMERGATEKHRFDRASAILSLAQFFAQEPGTHALIRERAINDPDKFPRTVAVRMLAEYFREKSDTFDVISERAIFDSSPAQDDSQYPEPYYVREAAIDALVRHWPDEPKTKIVLRKVSENDGTPWLRKMAEASLLRLAGG